MGPLRIAAVASISLLAACGGGVQVGSSSAPLDWTVPMGTYETSAPGIGKLKRLVLMADETAHLETAYDFGTASGVAVGHARPSAAAQPVGAAASEEGVNA